MLYNVNFVFLRHALSCSNIVGKKIYDKHIRNSLLIKYKDPIISDAGKQDSIKSGIELKEFIPKFDIVGSSVTLRAMETAYYTNSGLGDPFKEIYVFPYLREIEYNTINIKDPNNNLIANKDVTLNLSHNIKSFDDQKEYLIKEGINNYINFEYVLDDELRNQAGNIDIFIKWFSSNVLKNMIKDDGYYSDDKFNDIKSIFDIKNDSMPVINVLIFTHAHVIAQFSNKLVNNNTGFILYTFAEKKGDDINIYHKKDIDLLEPDIKRTSIKCPMEHCNEICNHINI